jgi:ArsR family metal-binding transcriptional regulator
MMRDTLIYQYDIEVFTPRCNPGAESWTAVARFSVDISEVLPYLNAKFQGAAYYQAASALTWKNDGHSIAIHPFDISVSNLEDRTEAEQVINGLVELINNIWKSRAEIQPVIYRRQRPAPMTLFKLLPHLNCKQCSQPTCFSFALQLAAGKQKPEECPPLLEQEYSGQLDELYRLVADLPVIY